MMKSRLYDQQVVALQRQGQFGVYSPGMLPFVLGYWSAGQTIRKGGAQ
jgi:hypothetical protein